MAKNIIEEALQRTAYLDPIQPNRLNASALAPKEIMYLTAKAHDSKTYSEDTTKFVHKIFSSMKLLDGDPYIQYVDRFFEEKNDTKEYTRRNKHFMLLVSLDDKYYDGVSLTYSETFRQKFDLPKESLCCITLFSKKQLNKVMIKKSSSYFPIILNDRVRETRLSDGTYEYKFTYNDGTPYMDFSEYLSCNNLNLSVVLECDQDPDVDVRIEYRMVLLNDNHWQKATVCYNVIPTNNPRIIVALGSLWLRDMIFDFENDIFKVAGDNEQHKIKRTYEREKFKDIVNRVTGSHDLIKINSIKYSNKSDVRGFDIYAEPLQLQEIVALDNRYVIKHTMKEYMVKVTNDEYILIDTCTDEEYPITKKRDYDIYQNGEIVRWVNDHADKFLYLDNEMVAVQKYYYGDDNRMTNGSLLVDETSKNSFWFSKNIDLSKNVIVSELQINYPLYVLRGVSDNHGFKYYLVNGSILEFTLAEDILKVKYDNNTIFEKENLSKWGLYKKEFSGPYNKISIRYREDNLAPDLQWFMIDGKCYIYWDELEYLTDPIIVNYILPAEYLDSATEKLISEGYEIEEVSVYCS